MSRWLAAAFCSLALCAALAVAALHRHAIAPASADTDAAACIYCTGGITAAASPHIAPVARGVWTPLELRAPDAPSVRPPLPLAHSGNAPPA